MALETWAERVRCGELQRHVRRLDTTPVSRSLMDELTCSLVDAVLAPVKRRLRHGAAEGSAALATRPDRLTETPWP